MQHEFIKEPHKATLHYRDEALRALSIGKKSEFSWWRLAADAAKQAARQRRKNSILTPVEMPFIDNFVRLGLALQKTNEALEGDSIQKKQQPFLINDVPPEIFFHYQYWMRCLVVNCSHHFEQEMRQLTEVARKYRQILPQTSLYSERAFHFFKMAQQHQQRQSFSASLQDELTIARLVSVAYEAAHLANIIVQGAGIAHEKHPSFLEHWETMKRYAEQVLSLRIKIVEASQLEQEQEVVEYSLAAFAMNDAAESVVQMLKAIIASNEVLAQQWSKTLPQALNIAERRVAFVTSQLPSLLQNDAAVWLEASLEADLKRIEAIEQEYHQVAFYWERSRGFFQWVALLCDQVRLVKEPFPSIARRWYSLMLRRLEKKAQKKIPIMFLEKVLFGMSRDLFPSFEWNQRWEKGAFVKFAEIGKSLTVHTWLYQTGSLLKQAGVNCEFFIGMPRLPCRGIVVTMSGLLYCYPKKVRFSPSLFVAGIVADDGIPHPAAAVHLIPNQVATKYLPFTEFIPHWPQPFLIPRDPARGKRFETIGFMGDPQNIAPELCSKEWHARLEKELGLRFVCRDFDDWHNFSDLDCVVAIRDFSTRRFYYKPAHKLYNAWLAEVPFIGGRDSAFAIDGSPGHDYLLARSAEEVFSYLKQLKEDPLFRAKLVENGRQSRVPYTRDAVLKSWKRLVQETLPVRALKWEEASALKRTWLMFLQRRSCEIQKIIFKYYKPKKYKFVIGKKPDPLEWASPKDASTH